MIIIIVVIMIIIIVTIIITIIISIIIIIVLLLMISFLCWVPWLLQLLESYFSLRAFSEKNYQPI